MGYCEVNDTKGEFKFLELSDESAISEELIEDFIAQESAYVDSQISGRYVVPVADGVIAPLVLKKIVARLSAERVRDVLQPEPNLPSESDVEKKDPQYFNPRKAIKDIQSGKIQLDCATAGKSAVDSLGLQKGKSNHFTLNKKQW